MKVKIVYISQNIGSRSTYISKRTKMPETDNAEFYTQSEESYDDEQQQPNHGALNQTPRFITPANSYSNHRYRTPPNNHNQHQTIHISSHGNRRLSQPHKENENHHNNHRLLQFDWHPTQDPDSIRIQHSPQYEVHHQQQGPSTKNHHQHQHHKHQNETHHKNKHHRRSRSLSIHITPQCSPNNHPPGTSTGCGTESHQRPPKAHHSKDKQVMTPCNASWGPTYIPPSHSCSNNSRAKVKANSNQSQSCKSYCNNTSDWRPNQPQPAEETAGHGHGHRTCPIYQPESQSNEGINAHHSQQHPQSQSHQSNDVENSFSPDQVIENLNQDFRVKASVKRINDEMMAPPYHTSTHGEWGTTDTDIDTENEGNETESSEQAPAPTNKREEAQAGAGLKSNLNLNNGDELSEPETSGNENNPEAQNESITNPNKSTTSSPFTHRKYLLHSEEMIQNTSRLRQNQTINPDLQQHGRRSSVVQSHPEEIGWGREYSRQNVVANETRNRRASLLPEFIPSTVNTTDTGQNNQPTDNILISSRPTPNLSPNASMNPLNSVNFTSVQKLPKPDRKQLPSRKKRDHHPSPDRKGTKHRQRRNDKQRSTKKKVHRSNDRNHYESQSSTPPTLFPFRKTPSGNFKIEKDMIAFESKQVAVLVDDRTRTQISFKQDKEYCPHNINLPPPPPPIPPMCLNDDDDPDLEDSLSPHCSSKMRLKNKCGTDDDGQYQQSHCGQQKNQTSKSCSRKRIPLSPRAGGGGGHCPSPCPGPVDQRKRENHCNRRQEEICTRPNQNSNEIHDQNCEPPPCWDSHTENQCHNADDFLESFHYRLRRAIHPDMKIIIDNKEFPCHSIALASYSKYFDCLKRPRETVQRVCLPKDHVSPEDFPNLMDWILLDDECKPRVISQENVLSLYVAAQYLGIPGLKDHCLCFINEKIQNGDPYILQMYEEACRKPSCKGLLNRLTAKLTELFPTIYKSRQFLSLCPEDLIVLISSDCVRIQNELQIYDTAVRWLLFDWENRCPFAIEVMSCVRFGLLTPLQLTQIQHCTEACNMPDYDCIFSIQEIKDILQEGLTYAIFRENYKLRPAEFNKWIECSKVEPPRARLNVEDNSDIFELPSKPSLTSYRSYCFEPCHSQGQDEGSNYYNNFSTNKTNDVNCTSRLNCHASESHIPLRDSAINSQNPHVHRSPSPHGHSTQESPPKETQPLTPSQSDRRRSSSGSTPAHHGSFFHGSLEPEPEPEPVTDPQHGNSPGYYNTNPASASATFQPTPDLEQEFQKRKNSSEKNPYNHGPKHAEAATKIQAHLRGYLARKNVKAAKRAKQVQKQLEELEMEQKIEKEEQDRWQPTPEVLKSAPPKSKSRLIPEREVILVFGGMNPQEEYNSDSFSTNLDDGESETNIPSNNCATIYKFIPEENLWETVGQMPEPRSHCGVVYEKNLIYVFGGTDPRRFTPLGKPFPTSTCWSFNPTTLHWTTHLSRMKTPRSNFGYCFHKGKIYVFGGKNAKGLSLSSCERFDPDTDSKGSLGTWQPIAPMQISCMSMAVSKFGDKIYIVGGVSAVKTAKNGKRPILKTVQTYNLKSNEWSYDTPLPTERCYAQLMQMTGRDNRQLFLLGGAGKTDKDDESARSLKEVLAYDDGEWEQVGKLKKARHGHCMVKMGKHFVVMGGVSSDTMEPLDTVEIYNTETNRSSTRVASMPQKLTGMAAVVI